MALVLGQPAFAAGYAFSAPNMEGDIVVMQQCLDEIDDEKEAAMMPQLSEQLLTLHTSKHHKPLGKFRNDSVATLSTMAPSSSCSSFLSPQALSAHSHTLDDESEENLKDDIVSPLECQRPIEKSVTPSTHDTVAKWFGNCMPWLVRKANIQSMPKPTHATYDLNNLKHLGLIASGSFASVHLVDCKVTQQRLALKVMSKQMIQHNQLQDAVVSEKNIMKKLHSPFCVRLAATFNRGDHVYLLQEAAMGGDLHMLYERRFLWGDEAYSQFYAACIASALDHLHSVHIVYRDLKLENVVLDARGNAKLCDFGIATALEQQEGRTYTVCGTSAYMAPEILSGSGYDCAVDWWAMGVLIFELMVSAAPFEATMQNETQVQLAFQKFRIEFGGNWLDLVQALCRFDPSERMRMSPEDSSASFAQHDWFSGFDWESLARQDMKAPYIPGDALTDICQRQTTLPQGTHTDCHQCSWADALEDAVGPTFY